jgi:hypothetical protein
MNLVFGFITVIDDYIYVQSVNLGVGFLPGVGTAFGNDRARLCMPP